MPAVPYPPGWPEDSRFKWYVTVPAAWERHGPEQIVRYAQHVLKTLNVTYNGGPAEVATESLNGRRYLLVNSDVDPATVIDPANLPAVPPSPQEDRADRLRRFRNAVRAGQAPTARETHLALADFIDVVLPEL